MLYFVFCPHAYKVSVVRDIARSLEISDKGSKVDIVNRLKKALNLDQTFLKLFAKMWGGSGLFL